MRWIPLVEIMDSHGTIKISRGITRRTGKENIRIDSRGKDTKEGVINVLHDEAGSPGIREFLRAKYGRKGQTETILEAAGSTDDVGRFPTEPTFKLLGYSFPPGANLAGSNETRWRQCITLTYR
jgi:hypothetical protein